MDAGDQPHKKTRVQEATAPDAAEGAAAAAEELASNADRLKLSSTEDESLNQ